MADNRTEPHLLIAMSGIEKRFTGVQALADIDFELRPGEVHILFGENGAGKSTLINIIAGTYPPDSGSFVFRGESLRNLTPHHARMIGISPVFQEFSLAPDLTVEENLFLGRELSTFGVLRKRAMREQAASVLNGLNFDLPVGTPVGTLSRAQQQMTEIAKALRQDVKVLILDEPTASLSERETETLFKLIDRLRKEGVGIIYVSHRMAEIKRLGDRVTVLRDGRKIGTVQASDVSEKKLVEMMTGRPLEALFPKIRHAPADRVLETKALSTSDGLVNDVDFHVHAGEVVGIAGLVGCGKSELARAIFGLNSVASGEIWLGGQKMANPEPGTMLSHGLCYFPSDRIAEGLALSRPVRENITMAALDLPRFVARGMLRLAQERIEVARIVKKMRVVPPDPERRVEFLSGGNRQKVMLARGLTRNIRVFLLDEPTVGIDVGAKVEVYNLVKELVEDGAAVVIVSSELPEVLHLSNRIYVMHCGSVVAELLDQEISETKVLSHFFDRRQTGDQACETAATHGAG